MSINDETGETWRNEILNDVSSFPEIGCVPSTLVVVGEDARPILSSPQRKNVWIAAGELGQGRIAVVGHTGYIQKLNTASGHNDANIKQFNDNLKKWLTRDSESDLKGIRNLKNLTKDSLATVKIVICTGEKNNKISDEQIQEYIQNGGSLLHAMCAWGWLQLNPNCDLRDMALNNILESVGIVYTKKYFWVPKAGLTVCSSTSSESDHVIHALENTHLDNCCKTLSQMNDVSVQVLHGVMKKSGHKVHKVIQDNGHKCVPSEKSPVSSSVGKSVMFLHEVMAKTGNGYKKIPGIEHFPGDFLEDPPVIQGKVIIESEIEASHPTGFYVRAGEEFQVEILTTSALSQGWEIQIGSHSDNLKTHTCMKRWPIISQKQKITKEEMKMTTAVGGLIYIHSPKIKSNITIWFQNVIESPLFDLTQPETVDNWKFNKNAHGLWADLCGRNIMFTLPSKSIRDIEDPTAVLESWDRVVSAHHHLRGSDPNTQRREWVVSDVQPSCGYMHSGYPIVTHLDVAYPENNCFLLNHDVLLTTGSWGMFHEIGHNMQRPSWTFRGTGEVTCNIFTLHAMDVISNKSPWIHSWLRGKVPNAHKHINEAYEFSKWQSDPGIALFLYAQIVNQFGWSVYKKTFRYYEENEHLPYLKTEQDKIDLWFQTTSKFSEYSLAPLADLWNIPLSDSCREELAEFTPFLPDDEITEGVSEKITDLLEKYPNAIRNIPKPDDQFGDSVLCRRKWSVLIKKIP